MVALMYTYCFFSLLVVKLNCISSIVVEELLQIVAIKVHPICIAIPGICYEGVGWGQIRIKHVENCLRTFNICRGTIRVL